MSEKETDQMTCPFCGSETVALISWAEEYRVACSQCGSRGPAYEVPSRAILVWQRVCRAVEIQSVLEAAQ